ncbi:two-component sensor histidine kinase [Pseudomonas sp. Choline-3u-10]|jgi:two-component system sensor histidine kinase QseC|uniref:ATP-binding protein n=1 Tax=Pseudomonadaceae TaxID=135621 RepID=UPI000617B526|nr:MULTISPECIES: ATP-binding protein [Pseudomonadaceae]AZZ44059.1 two-component sensor histidine kinase [Pseudomonadaceae bacterium SI-3]HBM07023.1 two-component sensor histidine kinase [Pseudomonas sp.]KJJ61766.1 histidine kinase [Pseudomonas sp. 10B238]MBK3796020.1 two-component sensor histidine kinase [Stutzerimonas stutzeri]MBK3876522.1 two-component sensor histidine kinase [Stutzerimonas stutzeri]|tara:strand:+ start:396 stop:1808 length:1413 start_codon:yes stop_codon:yes gene_type:complete
MLRRSIRNRTLVLVLGILLLSLSLISWRSYRDARHEIEELFDAQLAQSARLVQGLVMREMEPSARHALQSALDAAVNARRNQGVPGHDYETKLGFQVYAADGSSVLQSAGAPNGALQELAKAASASPFSALSGGYHDVQLDGHAWRLFLLHDPEDELWILVSERDDVRGELVGKIARRSLLPDLIGLPLLALLIWLAVGWGLRPLAHMAQLLKNRDPDNLAPLLLAPLPQELEPVAASLNRLLQQVNQLVDREKRFIADAAHELRTPLAVLRIHAQNAQQAGSEADRDEALRQLLAGVDRTTRVVTQLLTLARLEPSAQQLRLAPLDMRRLTRDTLAELTPLAIARDQELTLEIDEHGDYSLTGDAASLATLLQNLVGNALTYTPSGGRIEVQLRSTPDKLIIEVADSGPGIAPELREQLFERFVRLGDGQGAGLGLSIVARIAELHGATVELLDSALGGLRAIVRIPRT